MSDLDVLLLLITSDFHSCISNQLFVDKITKLLNIFCYRINWISLNPIVISNVLKFIQILLLLVRIMKWRTRSLLLFLLILQVPLKLILKLMKRLLIYVLRLFKVIMLNLLSSIVRVLLFVLLLLIYLLFIYLYGCFIVCFLGVFFK
jgi:hypothetical protein